MKAYLNKKAGLYLLDDERGVLVSGGRVFTLDKKWSQLFQQIRQNPNLIDVLGAKIAPELREKIDDSTIFQHDEAIDYEDSIRIPKDEGKGDCSVLFFNFLEKVALLPNNPERTGYLFLDEGISFSKIEAIVQKALAEQQVCLIGWVSEDNAFIKYFDPSDKENCLKCLFGRFISNLHLPKIKNEKLFPKLSIKTYRYLPLSSLTPLQKFSYAFTALKLWIQRDHKNVWVHSFKEDRLNKAQVLHLPDCSHWKE